MFKNFNKRYPKNSVDSIKNYATDLLIAFRDVNDRFHKEIEKHKYDNNPSEYNRIQKEYYTWIGKNISDRGFSFSYTPNGSKVLSIEMKLAN